MQERVEERGGGYHISMITLVVDNYFVSRACGGGLMWNALPRTFDYLFQFITLLYFYPYKHHIKINIMIIFSVEIFVNL